jgi:nucleotide-binding universal stress UspA family protein
MEPTIVIGVDLEAPDEARDALALAATLRAATDRLVLQYVFEPDAGAVTQQVARGAQAVATLAAGIEPAPEIRVTGGISPARILHELADLVRAQMIVVGSSRTAEPGTVCPGAVGEQLLHGGAAAVALAPRGLASVGRRPAAVGVAFGGTPESTDALARAARIAARSGAPLRALTVAEPQGAAAKDRIDERLRHALDVTGVAEPERERLVGDPAEALVRASSRLGLLVVGSRSYGPLGAVLLGAVTRRVVLMAHCPVMVVPHVSDAQHEVALVGGMDATIARGR